MTKKKIFITGASSELITKLISFIDKNDYKIYCLSRTDTKHTDKRIHTIKGDILEVHKFKEQLRSCEILIHAAALTHSFKKESYESVNLKATKDLVDIALELNIKKFIFISSRAAGFQSGAYGESKIRAENYVKTKLSSWLIFRPAEIYGGSKNEGIEKLFSDIQTKKYIMCPINAPKLYPVFIDDTAQIIHDISFNKQTSNQIITINGKKGFSYTELAILTSEIFQKKIRIIPIPKFMMLMMKVIIETFKINIGIMPDQISRLYGKKEIGSLNYDFMKIEDYLKKLKK